MVLANKIFHNKRALSEFMLDVIAIIFFIVALFFFFVVFKAEAITKAKSELKGNADIPTSSATLVSYLRTPVIVDGKQINVAELIRLWYLEPDKYKDILQRISIDVLDKLEYQYVEPNTQSNVIRGFQITINKEKIGENTINPLIQFKSKSFEGGLCISNKYGCINLGEQFIPVIGNSNLYIVLRESYKSK